MSAHTPGPWRAVPHATLTGFTIVAPPQMGDGLSEIVAHLLHEGAERDACLIAAAPRMAAALVAARDELDRLRSVHLPRYDGCIGEPSLDVWQTCQNALRHAGLEP